MFFNLKNKNMANYHVSQNKVSGFWEIKKDGNQNPSDYAKTQKEAEEIAKELCEKSGGGEVRIHGRDGRIRDSDTVPPGNDPFPPRDSKF
jgi:hypothetical protein